MVDACSQLDFCDLNALAFDSLDLEQPDKGGSESAQSESAQEEGGVGSEHGGQSSPPSPAADAADADDAAAADAAQSCVASLGLGKKERTCIQCGKVKRSMKCCSRCGTAYMCDVECQRLSWPVHRLECKAHS